MLHRFLFVAGMTVGVMVPLVWAAYVSRPASHAAPTPEITGAEATPEMIERARPAAEDVTASIPRSPKPDASPSAIAPSSAGPMARPARSRSQAVVTARRTKERTLPAVVDSYNGAHVITVCAALTVAERLRAGCP